MFGGFSPFDQNAAAHRAMMIQQEQQMRWYAYMKAEEERIRQANKGKAWKCGPWTWQT